MKLPAQNIFKFGHDYRVSPFLTDEEIENFLSQYEGKYNIHHLMNNKLKYIKFML